MDSKVLTMLAEVVAPPARFTGAFGLKTKASDSGEVPLAMKKSFSSASPDAPPPAPEVPAEADAAGASSLVSSEVETSETATVVRETEAVEAETPVGEVEAVEVETAAREAEAGEAETAAGEAKAEAETGGRGGKRGGKEAREDEPLDLSAASAEEGRVLPAPTTLKEK